MKSKKEILATEITQKLYKHPTVDKGPNMTHFYSEKKNAIHQADLLHLPLDKGYQYLLVIVDINSRLCDAFPLKTKQAQEVKNAFVKIYQNHKGRILEKPHELMTDSGSEFKNPLMKKYCVVSGIFHRLGKPGRHRQQGLVERYNQSIGYYLFRIMTMKQLLTKKINSEWVDHYKLVINEINKKVSPMTEKLVSPAANGNSKHLLKIGQRVLVALDNPEESTGHKLQGRFRAQDIKFKPQVREIKEIMVNPNGPPLYLLNAVSSYKTKIGKNEVEPIGYTYNQLLPITNDEVQFLSK
mgnify:FL=1